MGFLMQEIFMDLSLLAIVAGCVLTLRAMWK